MKIKKATRKEQFSYARPEDPLLKRGVIRSVERLTGSRFLQRIYRQLVAQGADAFTLWGQALRKLDITPVYDPEQLRKIPAEGPLIIIANHPFGLVDGAILLDLVTQVRKDYFLLINEVLAHEPFLKEHLLPVDFREDKAAIQTNLRTRQQTTERLQKGEALVIFPGGGVATAFRRGGAVEEWPWRKFISSQIHKHQCAVVPIFFHGQNSNFFHFVSRVSMNLRLGLLLREVRNKRGEDIQVSIGDPIPYVGMAHLRNRQQLIDFLYEQTMALGKLQPPPNED